MISVKLTQNPNMWKVSQFPPQRPMYFKSEQDAMQWLDKTKGLNKIYLEVVYLTEE